MYAAVGKERERESAVSVIHRAATHLVESSTDHAFFSFVERPNYVY